MDKGQEKAQGGAGEGARWAQESPQVWVTGTDPAEEQGAGRCVGPDQSCPLEPRSCRHQDGTDGQTRARRR